MPEAQTCPVGAVADKPPQRGVWKPPGQQHAVLSRKRFDFCTLYVNATMAKAGGLACHVVQISPLLSELLLKGAEFGVDWQRNGSQEHLLRVALDQVATQRSEPLHLPQAGTSASHASAMHSWQILRKTPSCAIGQAL